MLVLFSPLVSPVYLNNYTIQHPAWNTPKIMSFQRWGDFVDFVKGQKTDDDFRTIKVIDKIVRENIDYKVYWRKRNMRDVWKDHKGDCTDIAVSTCYFLNQLDIRCRLVHGIAEGELHDFYEYKVGYYWYSNESKYFDSLTKKGNGVW